MGLAGATRLTRSDFKLNLLLLKGQRCVNNNDINKDNNHIYNLIYEVKKFILKFYKDKKKKRKINT